MRFITYCLLVATLAACGGSGSSVRSTLGLNRQAPDEFKVVSRPPLSVPPDFALRPPEPGAPPLGQESAEEEAARVITGRPSTSRRSLERRRGADTAVQPVISSSLESSADARFLSQAGADDVDDDIRSKLYSEEQNPAQSDQSSKFAIYDLIGESAPDDIVDPIAEAERIRDNVDSGKPVNEGEVKTIQKDSVSTIEMLFE